MLSFRQVPGVSASTARAVGFLEGHGDLDAGVVFDGLSAADRKKFLFSVGLWVSVGRGPQHLMHGFEAPYNDCWVFKNVLEGHRFYGYLVNPQPNANPRFRLCVLTAYEQKKKDEMDYTMLKNRVLVWKNSSNAVETIAAVFRDKIARKQ